MRASVVASIQLSLGLTSLVFYQFAPLWTARSASSSLRTSSTSPSSVSSCTLLSYSQTQPFGSRIAMTHSTSSVAAIVEPADPPKSFTEEDWNEFSTKEVEDKGKEAPGGHKYRSASPLLRPSHA